MSLFDAIAKRLGRPPEGEGKLPFTLSTPGGGVIVAFRIEGPKQTFEVQSPYGRCYRVVSEKTPAGIKGMSDGSPAQLSITIEDSNSREGTGLKLKHLCYVFSLSPEDRDMQESLREFAGAVSDLRHRDTFARGISVLKEILEHEHRLFAKGDRQILIDALRGVEPE